MSNKCKCCNGETGGENYLYRDLKGVSVFTGFITKDDGKIVWVGKDEKHHRPIMEEDDRVFFLKEMSQYDK